MATPDICVVVGQRIRELRAEKGWSQQLLADHSELSREHVNKLETGQVEPGLRALERIALALDITLSALVER